MNKIKYLFYLLAVGLLLTGCISIPTGDGGKIKVDKGGIEIEGEDGEKSSIDVDEEEGGLTITTGKEDGTDMNINIGANAKIPVEFPKEIPVPSDEYLLMASETEEGGKKAIILSYQMEGDYKEITEKFNRYLEDNGYDIETMELGPDIKGTMGRKNEVDLTMHIIVDDENAYSLQIMYLY